MKVNVDKFEEIQAKLHSWKIGAACVYTHGAREAEVAPESPLTAAQAQELRESFGVEPDAAEATTLERARDPRLPGALAVLLSSPGAVPDALRTRAQAIVDRVATRIAAGP